MNITEAIATLDPVKDKHWTSDGLPRVDAVSRIMRRRDVTRRDITNAAPKFLRPQAADPGDHIKDPDAPETPAEEPQETPAEDPPSETPVEPETPQEPDEAPEETPAEAPAEEAPEVPTEEAPSEDPQAAARVKIWDQVMAMDYAKVSGSVVLIDRAVLEFGRQATILSGRKEAIEKKLKEIGQLSAHYSACRARLDTSSEKDVRRKALKAYQESCRNIREQRALRAQRFIDAETSVEDVRAQLEGPSKLDAAMRHRKPARGAVRPVFPVTATG